MTAVACNVGHVEKSNVWYLDSVAIRHMCNDNTKFTELDQSFLLSVSSVTENNYTVTFSKDCATVNRQDGSVALTAMKCGQLYIVNEKHKNEALTCEKGNSEIFKWHQRYRHLNFCDLKKVMNDNIVIGTKFASKSQNLVCDVCAKC